MAHYGLIQMYFQNCEASKMWTLKSWTFWFNIALMIFGVYAPMPDIARIAIITSACANLFLRLKTQFKLDLQKDNIKED